ncbi:MAG: GNAT family N-acetyltransferase [Actinomycetota bacterium]
MNQRAIDFENIFFETLTSQNQLPRDFDCGNQDLNDFLLEDALKHNIDGIATTTLVVYDGKVIGYFALCADAIRLDEQEIEEILTEYKMLPYKDYPAIKIARLAIHRDYQGKGVGTYLLDVIVGKALSVKEEHKIAVKFLSVDAKNNHRSLKFYADNGFLVNEAEKRNKPGIPVSMRYLIDNKVEPQV